MTITYEPIGYARTPFRDVAGMPIQPAGAEGVLGSIEILPRFADALADLGGFSHVIVLYHFHRAGAARMLVRPFLDDREHGVFATRAPVRPNPIGLSILRLEAIEGTTLRVANVDLLDGTPVLDIKPYVPEFDGVRGARAGWLEGRGGEAARRGADSRFDPPEDRPPRADVDTRPSIQ